MEALSVNFWKCITGQIARCGHNTRTYPQINHRYQMDSTGTCGLVPKLIDPITPTIPTWYFADGTISVEALWPTWVTTACGLFSKLYNSRRQLSLNPT